MKIKTIIMIFIGFPLKAEWSSMSEDGIKAWKDSNDEILMFCGDGGREHFLILNTGDSNDVIKFSFDGLKDMAIAGGYTKKVSYSWMLGTRLI